jgi:hypothetical protein
MTTSSSSNQKRCEGGARQSIYAKRAARNAAPGAFANAWRSIMIGGSLMADSYPRRIVMDMFPDAVVTGVHRRVK